MTRCCGDGACVGSCDDVDQQLMSLAFAWLMHNVYTASY